jgi:hypothetical protein
MQGVVGAPYRVACPVFVREPGSDDEWPSVCQSAEPLRRDPDGGMICTKYQTDSSATVPNTIPEWCSRHPGLVDDVTFDKHVAADGSR